MSLSLLFTATSTCIRKTSQLKLSVAAKQLIVLLMRGK